MLRLTQAPNLAIATLWADALAAEGIVTSVQRQYLAGVAGELPPDQCLPEVWITHPAQEPSSLSGLERGMRWSQTGMDARRGAQPMVSPLASAATPQTPRLAPTQRAGGEFGASRRCAASECTPVAPAFQARQAARARELLYHLQHVPQQRWHCRCGELVEGGFEQCWNCGGWMPR